MLRVFRQLNIPRSNFQAIGFRPASWASPNPKRGFVEVHLYMKCNSSSKCSRYLNGGTKSVLGIKVCNKCVPIPEALSALSFASASTAWVPCEGYVCLSCLWPLNPQPHTPLASCHPPTVRLSWSTSSDKTQPACISQPNCLIINKTVVEYNASSTKVCVIDR